MSARPRPATAGLANEDRLKTVLLAGLTRDVDAPGPDAMRSDVSRKRLLLLTRFRDMPPEETVADLVLTNPDLLAYILEFANGVSCKEMARRCLTNKAFAALCATDGFWKWQSQLRGYARASRLNPFRLDPAQIGPMGGSWREHYKWWCERVHDNDSIRDAVRDLDFNTGVHANYGHISDWDVSQVTDMRAMFAKATSFNFDLSRWNVSQETNMPYMFWDSGVTNPPNWW